MKITQKIYEIMFSGKVREAKHAAQDQFFGKLDKHRAKLIVTRNVRPYPFNMNQAEWELMVFSSGWNRAIEYIYQETDI